ncbi:MAG: hypothetical protein ACRD2Z_02260 [Thermoanaerobaculia bacterium]
MRIRPLLAWRGWLTDRRPLPLRRGLLGVAGGLLLLSLGAPWSRLAKPLPPGVLYTPKWKLESHTMWRSQVDWDGLTYDALVRETTEVPDWIGSTLLMVPGIRDEDLVGTKHRARVPIAVSGVLAVLAARRRSRRLLAAALTVASVGLVLAGGNSLMSPGWILLAAAAGLAAYATGVLPVRSTVPADVHRTPELTG